MPTDDQIRLEFEYIGAQKVAELKLLHAQLKVEVGELVAAFGRGEIAAEEFDAEMKKMAVSSKNLEKGINDLTPAKDKAAKSSMDLGRAFLEVSRAAEDAQYGLAGVLNNLPGIVQMFGGPAGLAALVSITAVGFATLAPRIKAAIDAMSGGNPKEFVETIATLSKHLKELQDKPIKLVFDMTQIDALQAKIDSMKKGAAQLQAELAGQSVAERASGKAVQETLAEAGPGTARAAQELIKDRLLKSSDVVAMANKDWADATAKLAELERQRGKDLSPEGMQLQRDLEKEQINKLNDARNRVAVAQKAIADQAGIDYGNMVRLAEKGSGEEMTQAQAKLAKILTDVGAKTAALDVQAGGPAQQAKFAAAEEDFKVQKKDRERQDREAKDAAAEEKAADAAVKRARDYWLDVEIAAEKASLHQVELQNKDAMEKEKAETKEQKDLEAGARKARDQQIAASGAGAEAGAIYAAARGRGRSPDQAFEEATQRALAFLNRQIGVDARGRAIQANRGMSDEQKNLLATQIASQGRANVNQGVAGLAGRNLTTTGKLQMVAAGLDAEVTMMQQRLQDLDQRVNTLGVKGDIRRRGALKTRR